MEAFTYSSSANLCIVYKVPAQAVKTTMVSRTHSQELATRKTPLRLYSTGSRMGTGPHSARYGQLSQSSEAAD